MKEEEIIKKYKERLETELGARPIISREYKQFRKEIIPRKLTFYERLCKISEKTLRIKPDEKKSKILQESISICHLEMTPSGAVSFSILIPLLSFIILSLLSYVLIQSIFFILFFFIIAAVLIKPLENLPNFLANNWRLKASNQMVLCIFYVVTYMRHTSNLENAIRFAADHLLPPLSLDLKKIIWDMETGRYESIKESLDKYLETWRKWNLEFIESFHLIEGSLYEASESRRLTTLDKALDVMLEETYEKMLHYAQNLKNPMTMLHMIGIILPILGLVILPLIVSFMPEIKWYHIATLYNIALPIGIYYLGKTILSKRPTGYGQTDISENPELRKYRNILINIGKLEIKLSPLYAAIITGVVLFLIGFSPVLIHYLNPNFTDFGIGKTDEVSTCGKQFCFLDYHEVTTEEETSIRGPYGIGATLLGLFIPISLGIGFGLYYKLRSNKVIKIRENAKKLEDEFASGLFQLGNRLGDNLPAEIAFGKVADVLKGTSSGRFFEIVSSNIRRVGMSVKEAIFNKRIGAITYFPSNIIDSSMRILIESIKKGPMIAAEALVNISRYIKEIHRVNERLKDLMEDIISSMKSQISFLAPAISGIVVGITSMVAAILGKLSKHMALIAAQGTEQSPSLLTTGLFSEGVPPYYFQIIVGLYIVQIVYILTILINGIENGSDKLNERYLFGKNLTRSILLYSFIAFVILIIFNFIAAQIMVVTLT